MPDTLPLTGGRLDEVLASYEAREPAGSTAEAELRRQDLALGDQFNRIQGVAAHPAIERLGKLWCTGRIDRLEYFDLLGRMGRFGLLT